MRRHQPPRTTGDVPVSTSRGPTARSLVFVPPPSSTSTTASSSKRAQIISDLEKLADPATALDHRIPPAGPSSSSANPPQRATAINRQNRPRVPLFVPPRKVVESSPNFEAQVQSFQVMGQVPQLVAQQTALKPATTKKEADKATLVAESQVFTSKDSKSEKASVTTVSKPRPSAIKRKVLAGIHCSIWGNWKENEDGDDDEDLQVQMVVILLQKSREDFDFPVFLESAPLPNARFVLLEEWSWGSSLLETLQVLLRTVLTTQRSSPRVAICAGGAACWYLLDVVSALRSRIRSSSTSNPLSWGFVYCSPPSETLAVPMRVSGLEGMQAYFESDVQNGGFETTLRTSGVVVKTCRECENLLDYLRKDGSISAKYVALTQYVPTGQELVSTKRVNRGEDSAVVPPHVKSAIIEETKGVSMLFLVSDVHIQPQRQMVRLWTCSLRKQIRTVELSRDIAVVTKGDVISVPWTPFKGPTEGEDEDGVCIEWNKAVVLARRDDPLRATFVRLATRQRNLPLENSTSPSRRPQNQRSATLPVLPLAQLLQGDSLEEERRDLHVRIVDVDTRRAQVLVWDESIPQGTLCRVQLSRDPTSLHRAAHFIPNTRVELRNVRIEMASTATRSLNQSDDGRFKLYLDNQSGRADLPESSSTTSEHKAPVRFVELRALGQCGAGDYRVRARIDDILFQGYSYRKAMRTWKNIFAWSDHLVEKMDSLAVTMREFTLFLVDDGSTEEDVMAVRVGHGKTSEALPFVTAELLVSDDLDVRHRHLLLTKQILDALVHPKNKLCEFSLRIASLGSVPELITMDV